MSEDKEQFNDDISIEPEENEVDGFGRSKKEKDLREKLKKCQKEKQEYLSGWQRSKAELINKKKEFEEEKKKIVRFANEDIIADLTGVLDSFSMAFKDKAAWEEVPKGWRDGVEHIHSQFLSLLTNYGLEEVSPDGEEFDPHEHDSAGKIETDDESKDGYIAEVVRKGYTINGKVVRPAQVKVYEYK